MDGLFRFLLGISLLAISCSVSASAQTQKDEDQQRALPPQSSGEKTPINRAVTGQAGRDIRIGVFASLLADCTSGPLPIIRLKEPPKHGAVTVKQGKLQATNHQKCLAAEVPAFIVVYRSQAEFEGRDEVALHVGTGDKRQIQRITITVTGPKGVQRI